MNIQKALYHLTGFNHIENMLIGAPKVPIMLSTFFTEIQNLDLDVEDNLKEETNKL